MRQAESPPGTLLFFVRPLILCGALLMGVPLPRLHAQKPAVSGSEYTLRTEVDLLSVAVRVTDRNDNEIHGLTADQFSLYEDGAPQKISFFDAAAEPVSLGILLDVSGSMGASGKLDQAKEVLSRVISTMRPADEILYLQFHVKVDEAVDFTSDSNRILSAIFQTTATESGTSLYDAIARGLCYMRKARYRRQALLVITDGTDENSHRSLGDLVPIVQASQAQVFVIGCLDKEEYDMYRESRSQKVPLVTRQEVDNPITAFNQLARESGAESFFPASPAKLQEAVEAVAHQLRTQYTLAYYPKVKGDGFHHIEVRVAQAGARVRARRGFAEAPEPSAGCGNEKLKPYPYESKVTTKNGCTVYHEDFQDTASGWPNKKGYHYKSGAYEIVNAQRSEPLGLVDAASQVMGVPAYPIEDVSGGFPLEGVLVANGPLFGDLNASVSVDWKSAGGSKELASAPGLVFRLHNRGYYAVLVSREAFMSARLAFKLVKKYHSEPKARDLLPWTELPLSDRFLGPRATDISVQCRGPVITIIIQDTPVAKFKDDDFKDGMVGMVLHGAGRAAFRDLLAEEARDAGLELALSHEASPHSSESTTSPVSPPLVRGERPDGSVHTPLVSATAAELSPTKLSPVRPPEEITKPPVPTGIESKNAPATFVDLPPDELAKQVHELKNLTPADSQVMLPMILERVGATVEDFLNGFPNTACSERITSEVEYRGVDPAVDTPDVKTTEGRNPLWRDAKFNYVALAKPGDKEAPLVEYRTDTKGGPAKLRGAIVTSGFVSLIAYFRPAYQPDSRFRYLGRELVKNQNTYVVAFAQRPGVAWQAEQLRFLDKIGLVLLQGVAWIDPVSFAILRLRTEILEPYLHVGLRRETTEVEYSEVTFKGSDKRLWLPRQVTVSGQLRQSVFSNQHHYSQYRLFIVEAEENRKRP
jgi:VWFA-related protein